MGTVSGGCACGGIRYKCEEPPIIDIVCHCRDCQRASGSAYAALSIVPTEKLTFAGQPKYHAVKAESGRTMRRGFCPQCGSPVSITRLETPAITFLQAASLDDPSKFSPKCEVWVSSAHPWQIQHGVPSFGKAPSEEAVRGPIAAYFAQRSGEPR